VDDTVGDVTIFVFCYRRVTANVSSAAAVTAVVKQSFRTVVRVVGKFLCQRSSAFLVQGMEMSIRSALVWDITQRREASPYRRSGTTYLLHIQRSRIPKKDFFDPWILNR
jgi:hypothetical protein